MANQRENSNPFLKAETKDAADQIQERRGQPRVRLYQLPPNLPDRFAKTPEDLEFERQARSTIERIENARQACMFRLPKRRIWLGSAAIALTTDGLVGEKVTAPDVAVLVGLCGATAPDPEKDRAAGRVRGAKYFAFHFYHCSGGHRRCVGPCALNRGRRLIAAIFKRARHAVSRAEFELASSVIERLKRLT